MKAVHCSAFRDNRSIGFGSFSHPIYLCNEHFIGISRHSISLHSIDCHRNRMKEREKRFNFLRSVLYRFVCYRFFWYFYTACFSLLKLFLFTHWHVFNLLKRTEKYFFLIRFKMQSSSSANVYQTSSN